MNDPVHAPTVLLANPAAKPVAETRLEILEVLATTAHARLRALALIGLVTFTSGMLLALTLPALLGRPPWEQVVMAAMCAFLSAVSFATWMFAKRARPAATTIIHVGLAYVVIASLAMALAEVAIGPRAAAEYDGVPGLCIWIVLFPLIIPCLPSQALVAALLCATTLPIAYQVFVLLGREPSDAASLIRWCAPGFFCAGVAWAAAWVFGRLASDVARSRREVQEMGAYQLVDRLGHGGMGEVWRANHRFLPRQAAVKFVRPSDDQRRDPAMVQDLARRFEREAKAIALLRSPHTIQLYDFGLSPEGDLFYAMELLDGYDLETLISRFGPQPENRVCRILEQMCLSLGEAHRAGLVHRDVKPGNIMLCRLGEDLDVVKVLDFGLVGAAQSTAVIPGSAHGVTGFAGTPGYIAPELIFGQAPATAASDLYGVGAVAYWLLTGTTVFPGSDGNEDLVAHSMDSPQPPSQRLGRPIDARLESLVLSCLAKRPQDRPNGALDLRDRLRTLGLSQAWNDQQARAWWDATNAAEARQP
jgi:serine/threonine-protein kinase